MMHLTAFAAITGCRFRHASQACARHVDSPVGSVLADTPESTMVGAMTPPPTALPDDIDALEALLAAERAGHAVVLSQRDEIARERDRLAACNGALETRAGELATRAGELAARATTLEASNATLEASTATLEAANAKLAADIARIEAANARLEQILAEVRRAHFGRKSERISDDQLALALEELETAAAKIEAEVAKADTTPAAKRPRRPRQTSGDSLDHLAHEEVVIEPAGGTICPCCQGQLHRIGEDSCKRLDKVPAKVRVIVEIRPKYACRTCEKTGADEVAGIVQAPAPAHLIEGGLPTEALIADIVVSKHADHLPIYRQSQILARHGVKIERSTLAHWVGAAAAELQPLHDHLLGNLKASPKLFCDETRCPVLDPG